jgi:hypothetical protein
MHERGAERDVGSLRRRFIELVHLTDETENAGELKQLFEEQRGIAERLVELGHHTAHELLPLVEHRDSAVRLAAAYLIKPFDPTLCVATLKSLAVTGGKTALEARSGLRWLESAGRD